MSAVTGNKEYTNDSSSIQPFSFIIAGSTLHAAKIWGIKLPDEFATFMANNKRHDYNPSP